ncbi:MAG TPA: type III pantothenate kinase [Campylobacterales bacterium]|nr:type III pantothenate kinase [Campylobacterales bacterium]
MYLADIGNSNIKIWRDGEVDIFPIHSFSPNQILDRVFYISSNPNFSKQLHNFPNWKDVSYLFHANTQYRTLGIDRIVAIDEVESGIVVDMGTAVTIDIVRNFQHLGGYILLGKKASFETFQNKTPHLNIDDRKLHQIDTLPLFSEDAIYSGFFHSIANFVIGLKERYKIEEVLITGGDGEELSKVVKNSKFRRWLLFEKMEKRIRKII